MSNLLFKRPKGVRYVDMCIYIDEHIYDELRDDTTIFTYMYLLAYMLASKQKYFTNVSDYDGFAYYVALLVYNRMIQPGQKVKIKSVLNYMKSILYFRKLQYNDEVFKQVINPEFDKEWNSDKFKLLTLSSLLLSNSELLSFFVFDTLNKFPEIIRKSIPSVYKGQIANRIYTSALLTLLNRFTLSTRSESYFNTRALSAPAFDVVNYLGKQFREYEIILWHLPDDMKDIVRIVINKSNKLLIDSIVEIMGDFEIDDDTYLNISNDMIFGDNDEEY